LQELEGCLTTGRSVEEKLHAEDVGNAIARFLSQQSKENRVIFVRRYWFLDSYDMIAEQTGLSVKTVSVRLTRLRKKLKDYLLGEGVL